VAYETHTSPCDYEIAKVFAIGARVDPDAVYRFDTTAGCVREPVSNTFYFEVGPEISAEAYPRVERRVE
jgi:hypothetical protein